MEGQSGGFSEFYSNWRSKHGKEIIGSSIAVATGVVLIGLLKREPVDGLAFAVGAYTLSVGFHTGRTMLWETSRLSFISTREAIREGRYPSVSVLK